MPLNNDLSACSHVLWPNPSDHLAISHWNSMENGLQNDLSACSHVLAVAWALPNGDVLAGDSPAALLLLQLLGARPNVAVACGTAAAAPQQEHLAGVVVGPAGPTQV